jgi:lysophospholipase L1-like esterase
MINVNQVFGKTNSFLNEKSLRSQREFASTVVKPDNTFIPIQNKPGRFVPLDGNIEQMKKFFSVLKNSKNKVIRIAHYGDSLIQGDLISAHLRDRFQSVFGGVGAGFLSIVSNDIKMRYTTKHSFSDDWEYVSIVTRNVARLPLGIAGTVAIPKLNSWVKYEAQDYLSSTSSFSKIKIYYSHAENLSLLEYIIDEKIKRRVFLETGSNLHSLEIDTEGFSQSIEIKFISGHAPYIYGVSLESGNGVYLDNFAMPGNTGSSLLEIPEGILQDFNKINEYSLIILTYGANVSSPYSGIFQVYENKMVTVIQQFKKIFRNASFLLIGVGDKTVKRGNQFVTNPDVEKLLNTQRIIVEKTDIAFWNLWDAMGGQNSMTEWVNAAPPMALQDYSHFTPAGAERVANLLYDAILDLYNRFENSR